MTDYAPRSQGITVYRAIKYSNTKIGDWIVLPGAGGGLGHLAVQYARAMGLRVIAVDTGADKKKLVMGLGAEKWIDFKESKDIVKDIKDACDGLGPHAAVVTAAHVSIALHKFIFQLIRLRLRVFRPGFLFRYPLSFPAGGPEAEEVCFDV